MRGVIPKPDWGDGAPDRAIGHGVPHRVASADAAVGRAGWIEVARDGDRLVVNVLGVLEGYQQLARRWARGRVIAAIATTLAVGAAILASAAWAQLDVEHRRTVRKYELWLTEAEARADCLERGIRVSAVRECVRVEVARRMDTNGTRR